MIVIEDDSKPRDIADIVDREFPGSFQVNRKCWLVSGKSLNTRNVARKLGMSYDDEEEPSAIDGAAIFRITPSYWGIAKNEMWDWLTAAFERSDG